MLICVMLNRVAAVYIYIYIYKVMTWLIFYLSSCYGRTRTPLIRRRPMGVLYTNDKWLPNWSHSPRTYYNHYLYLYIYRNCIPTEPANMFARVQCKRAYIYICTHVFVRVRGKTRVCNDNKIIIAILRAFDAYIIRDVRCSRAHRLNIFNVCLHNIFSPCYYTTDKDLTVFCTYVVHIKILLWALCGQNRRRRRVHKDLVKRRAVSSIYSYFSPGASRRRDYSPVDGVVKIFGSRDRRGKI